MKPDADYLTWNSDTGVGFLDCWQYLADHALEDPYDQKYYENYCHLGNSEMGDKITAFRVGLANKYGNGGLLVDVGCGSGSFIEARIKSGKETKGFDVMPPTVAWLKSKDLFHDLTTKVPVLTFHDSLEHIRDPAPILALAEKFVIVCIPIFKDLAHVLKSRHWKPREHCHYFSHLGFVSYMWNQGLRLVEYSDVETQLGRDSVRTFVFRRA